MAEPIEWSLAERVAVRVGGQEPLAESYHAASLARDFEEVTAEAEALVVATTGLQPLAGPSRGRVTDRAGWVRANLAAFRRLLRPLLEDFGQRMEGNPLTPIGRRVTAVQVGMLLGWMSTRVLGQYDLLVLEDTDEEQDLVYYVGPNVLAVERRYGFPPRQFRLWLALHEVTHRLQFTGVPWMRGHYLGLVEESLRGLDPDPRRFVEALKRSVESVRRGENPLDDGGVVAMLAGPEQFENLQRIQGMMSLLEGHGDITMNRAGRGHVPSADRFHRALHQRRTEATGPLKLVQQLLGLEAKLKQYAQGERFLEAVEAAGGDDLVKRLWEAPEHLPTLGEIRDPRQWLERMSTRSPVATDSLDRSSDDRPD